MDLHCKRCGASRDWKVVVRSVAILRASVATAPAQVYTQRGFFETRNYVYPQTTPNDSAHLVAEQYVRYEATWKPRSWLRLNGSIEGRFDSHRQVERSLRLDWRDLSLERPALSLRRLSVLVTKGKFTLEAGRQFVRWGKADLLNPMDRFAPRDFLNPINTELLGVTGARLGWESGNNSIDMVYVPVFTPSRAPLLNQRWSGALVQQALDIPIHDYGLRTPGRGQAGVRWNHMGKGFESSLSFYEGFNHLPLFDVRLRTNPQVQIDLQRFFPRLRQIGGDAAVPLRWFTIKGEAGYYQDPGEQNDEFLLFVVQMERQAGEWLFAGGYAGEIVTTQRLEFAFAPDRGIARTFLGRVSYNVDANRTVAFDGAIRQNGAGGYAKFEYSQTLGDHWRATAAVGLLRGSPDDFFGQYRLNSHLILSLRYSF